MLSVHGLIRGHDPELGRDADTGGQVTYVLDLARALGRHPDVAQVDLLTRLIEDPSVSRDYAIPEEELGPRARIVRLPFGPRRYIRKELLWRHLDQLVDRCLELFRGEGRLPDLVHSHYADAGYVGVRLSQALAIPQVHTGHSLGRVKLERLLSTGRKGSALEREFNFSRRFAAEEEVLVHASLIVASSREEAKDQYGLYERFDPRRCVVIPPGADLSRFMPPGRGKRGEEREERASGLIDRFLREPRKPLILAICRPVEQKNVRRLLAAYGEDPQLMERANLAIVSGNRNDIREAADEQRQLFTELLLDVDRYDLYGKVALPKRHTQEDIPEIYRLAARRRGVFADVALTEPFGLTLVEAAASGVPVVATQEGGARDIVESCRNGLLVDPVDTTSIASALGQVLSDERQWRRWSRNGLAGVSRAFTWDAHVKRYLKAAVRILRRERKQIRRRIAYTRRVTTPSLRPFRSALVTDIDQTLVGDVEGLEALLRWLRRHREDVLFGVATGRVLGLAVGVLEEWGVGMPDVMITGVGSEIHYGPELIEDTGWSRHIRFQFRREALERALGEVPGLTAQPAAKQGTFKLSYDVAEGARMPPLDEIEGLIRSRGLNARLIASHDAHLDVLPLRASKGLAIRHLAYTQGVPLRTFLVAGDSGNDVEMLLGDTLAVVVGNHTRELEALRGAEQVYFAQRSFAHGILEGIAHYGFGDTESTPEGKELACSTG